MKSICLRGHEVRGLLDGTVSLLVRPVKEGQLRAGHTIMYGWEQSLSPDEIMETFRSPFGAPGDRLWVRETFAVQPDLWAAGHGPQPVHYLADTPRAQIEDYVGKPSIHMPRWACRRIIETVSVRVGPVRKITVADARPAGVDCGGEDDWQVMGKHTFAQRWQADYGKRHPWESAFAWFAKVKIVEEPA